MKTDYAEREREFVADLAPDTGRDLAAWMTAIAESGHGERNAIIDWLRHQGFQFAWASWLERIHHNGGRLIYGDDTPSAANARLRAQIKDAAEEPPTRSRPPAQAATVKVSPPSPATAVSPASPEMVALLSEAKGLRPLADIIVREIIRTVPETTIAIASPLLTFAGPRPFAALLANPRKLRLYGPFGPTETPRGKPAEPANRMAPPFPYMLLLDDARAIDEDFRRLIRAAAAR
jgi:hypothetical protein